MAKKWSKQLYNHNDRLGGIDIAEELLDNIREQDAEDMVASGVDMVFEICACLQNTEQSYIYRGDRGQLLCIMGISKYIPDAAGRCIYMLGTNAINDTSYIKQLLVTEAKKVIREWVFKHGIIFNAVNVNNEKSIRWLTKLGAIWLPEDIKTEKGLFKQFIITKGSVCDV